MSVDIKDNTVRIKAYTENNISLGLRLMLEDTHRLANQVTPYREGALRTMVTKRMENPLAGVISWYAPYAWYQERGYTTGPVVNYTTPGTHAWFAKESVEKVVDNARNYFTQSGAIK